MRRLFAAGLALLLMGQAAPAPLQTSVASFSWMTGRWQAQNVRGRWTHESWSTPEGNLMLGYSRSGYGVQAREFEFLRIAPGADGVPVYYAQPSGRPAVAFRLVARENSSATFENPGHDYPQRIRYVRTGDTMVATISRLDGSSPMSWSYSRRD